MDVRVLESGQQRPAAQVHHLGPPADQVADVAVGVADGDDPVAAHGDRAGRRPAGDPAATTPAAGGIGGVDGPAGEDHVRLLAHAHLLIFATTRARQVAAASFGAAETAGRLSLNAGPGGPVPPAEPTVTTPGQGPQRPTGRKCPGPLRRSRMARLR